MDAQRVVEVVALTRTQYKGRSDPASDQYLVHGQRCHVRAQAALRRVERRVERTRRRTLAQSSDDQTGPRRRHIDRRDPRRRDIDRRGESNASAAEQRENGVDTHGTCE